MTNNDSLTLGDLKASDQVEVTGFKRDSKEMTSKLLAMGISRGAAIKVLRFAPLGDPIDIEVKGTNLSLRKEEAKLVYVRRV
ncbi:MAG: ferrous iron transport protein A [Spirochaetales bacterium]|nr:ferrous iron transport protein A [Spirochaetales bacterium]